jgi:hypothetical protein
MLKRGIACCPSKALRFSELVCVEVIYRKAAGSAWYQLDGFGRPPCKAKKIVRKTLAHNS